MAISTDYKKDISGPGKKTPTSNTLHIKSRNGLLIINRQYVPEYFIWNVFYYLIEAVAAMANGPDDGSWDFDEIVHRDIIPANGR